MIMYLAQRCRSSEPDVLSCATSCASEDRNMTGEMETWGPQSSTDELSLTCSTIRSSRWQFWFVNSREYLRNKQDAYVIPGSSD